MKGIERVLCLLVLLFALPAVAIRSVGNGGGEAEMIALQQLESLPVWEKFCQENPKTCFQEGPVGSQVLLTLQRIGAQSAIESIQFVNASEFQVSYRAPTLILTQEELYIDDQHPKSRIEIFQRVLTRILQIENPKLENLTGVLLDPKVTYHGNGLTAQLQGSAEDYLVLLKGSENLHVLTLQLLQTDSYRVQGLTENGYLLSTTQGSFELRIERDAANRLQLRKSVHYGDSGE